MDVDVEYIRHQIGHFPPQRKDIERQKDGSFVVFGLCSFSGEFGFLGREPNFRYAKELLLDEFNKLVDYVAQHDARVIIAKHSFPFLPREGT